MAPEPFDLDAFIAEAEATPFEFKFAGETYVIAAHMDLRASLALDEGDLGGALRIMLGPEQWERLRAADATFDRRALLKLLAEYARHSGTALGESLASAGSSRSTGRRSKQTSKRTTKLR